MYYNAFNIQEKVAADGFAIIESIYSDAEINSIVQAIENVETTNPTFRKSADLFAIRQFFKEVSNANELLLTPKLNQLVHDVFGAGYFVVKSIYFDKPGNSNWFVSYHQDLTISVDKKQEEDGFVNWTVKQNQYAVQPPIAVLQNNFTIRVHLDDTDENNGALKVISASHLKGIYRAENIDFTQDKETACCVEKGGIMIMKPLLMHSSSRTINNRKRRVVHIEFSKSNLPAGINWAEMMLLN